MVFHKQSDGEYVTPNAYYLHLNAGKHSIQKQEIGQKTKEPAYLSGFFG